MCLTVCLRVFVSKSLCESEREISEDMESNSTAKHTGHSHSHLTIKLKDK